SRPSGGRAWSSTCSPTTPSGTSSSRTSRGGTRTNSSGAPRGPNSRPSGFGRAGRPRRRSRRNARSPRTRSRSGTRSATWCRTGWTRSGPTSSDATRSAISSSTSTTTGSIGWTRPRSRFSCTVSGRSRRSASRCRRLQRPRRTAARWAAKPPYRSLLRPTGRPLGPRAPRGMRLPRRHLPGIREQCSELRRSGEPQPPPSPRRASAPRRPGRGPRKGRPSRNGSSGQDRTSPADPGDHRKVGATTMISQKRIWFAAAGAVTALILAPVMGFAASIAAVGGLFLVGDTTTPADLSAAMKVIFEDSIINNVVADSELLDLFESAGGIKTEETTGGRYIETAQLFALPAGVGSRGENGYIPVPRGPVIQNSKIYLKKVIGSVEMTGDVLKRVRTDIGAFINWGEQAMPKLVERVTNEYDRMLLGYGSGVKAQVASVNATDKIITLKNAMG